VTNNSSFIC